MLLYTFRGVANKDLTCEMALKIAAIGNLQFREDGFKQILLAGDHRLSTPMLKSSLTAGFLSAGLDVIDCGMLPTPVLSATVKREGIPGIMVTASHNPPEWNGLQFHEPDSHIYGPEKEEKIKSMLDTDIPLPNWVGIGKISSRDSCIDEYIAQLLSIIEMGKSIKVVADYGGGMASVIVPDLLKQLSIDFVEISKELDPFFTSRPSEPSADTIAELREAVVRENADAGFAYDGDADRLMIVDEKGDVVPGDKIIYLLTKEMLSPPATIVVTADISMVVENALRDRGFEVVRDRWGQTFMGNTIRQLGAAFGAETNDHYMFPELSLHADAIAATAFICSILSKSDDRLSCMFDELPATHVYREKLLFTEDLVSYAEKISPFLGENYGGYDLVHDRLYVTRANGSKLLIRQSPFDRYVRVFAESFHPGMTDGMISGVKGVLGLT